MHAILLLLFVLLHPLLAADRAASADLNIKAEEVEPAIKGDWEEAGIACVVWSKDPIGINLTRNGDRPRIQAYHGSAIGESTPISSETLASIIAGAIKHHAAACVPARAGAPSESLTPAEKFRLEYKPSILISLTRKGVTKSRHVVFEQNFPDFAKWLAGVVALAKDRPNPGMRPENFAALLKGAWRTLEVELIFENSGLPTRGLRYTRIGEVVRVASYERQREETTMGEERELGANDLSQALSKIVLHYTTAFNEHDDAEASLDEKIPRLLLDFAARSIGRREAECGTGNIGDPRLVMRIVGTNGPNDKATIGNGIDIEGFAGFADFIGITARDLGW